MVVPGPRRLLVQRQMVPRCCNLALRVCAFLMCFGIGTQANGRRGLIPYRDVQPPAQHEDASSLWLRGLPPLERNNSALQWCDHYADVAPPIWDTGHAGVALKGLMATEYNVRGGERRRAVVMSCGTGSDAIFLLEMGFQRVACVEICSGALLQGIAKLWRRLEQKGRNAHILFVRGDGKVDRFDTPGLTPPRRSDPTVEFHEQDNQALSSLETLASAPEASLWDDAAAAISPRPPADFIYDNSCYNNMRQAALFPGALARYFRAVQRVLSPRTGLLHIVSGASSSEAKIPFFPEHDEDELRDDLRMAPWLQLVPSYPRPATYDFRTETSLLEAAQLNPAQAKLVQREGGTAGWSSLLRLLPPSVELQGQAAQREL